MRKKTRIKDRVADIQIEASSAKLVRTIHQALKPELHASNSLGSRVKIQIKENSITFYFEARSTAILRALINSYLRWFITLKNSIDVINSNDPDLS